MKPTARDCLCLALDNVERDTLLRLADGLHKSVGCFKINAAFVRYGPDLVRELKDRSIDVFLDLKFHDIPATVDAHVRAAAAMGVDWLTVHAAGGAVMLRAAADSAARAAPENGGRRPRLLAVTVLTSLDQPALNGELRVPGPVEEQVAHLADMALAAGMDGIVCSATDLPVFRDRLPDGFYKVTPGIGGLTSAAGADQKRVADPVTAIRAGASMLVIGRAILGAPDPLVAAREIGCALESALRDTELYQ